MVDDTWNGLFEAALARWVPPVRLTRVIAQQERASRTWMAIAGNDPVVVKLTFDQRRFVERPGWPSPPPSSYAAAS